MRRVQEAPNPWALLCTWSGWRGLRETLQSLEQLLRRVGAMSGSSSSAVDLADALVILLSDPASMYMPPHDRLQCSYRKADLLPGDGGDMDTELSGWIDQLGRIVRDTPLLLRAGDAATYTSHVLTGELPRLWQTRFSAVVRNLQQMLQASGARKARQPVGSEYEPLPALPEVTGSLTNRSRYVVPDGDGGYALVLPGEAGPHVLPAAWAELSYFVLQDHGVDALRLHLLLLAHHGETLAWNTVFGGLGLDLRRTALRPGYTTRCYDAIRRLQQIKLTVYRWSLGEHTLAYERTLQDLWDLRIREFGQARVFEHAGALAAHGEDWSLLAGAAGWAAAMPPDVLQKLSQSDRTLLEQLDGARQPLSLALGALLGLHTGAGDSPSVTVATRDWLRLAGVDLGAVTDQEARRRLWQQLWGAIRLQRSQGWQAEPGDWHALMRRQYGRRPKADEQEPGGEGDAPSPDHSPDAWTLLPESTTTFLNEQA